jgi:hypothetical protein
MSNALVPSNAQGSNDALFKSLATSMDFLPYITLVQSNADLCKPNAPTRVDQGRYASVKGKSAVTDLGNTFTAAIVAWRPTARIVDKRGVKTKILSFHDPATEEFKTVQAKADVKPQPADYICYFGFEYLLWVEATERFETFYCNSITSRRHAQEAIHPLLGKVATFGSQFIETKAYSWWGPDVKLATADLMVSPDQLLLDEVYAKFMAAKDSTEAEGEETEEVADTASASEDNR